MSLYYERDRMIIKQAGLYQSLRKAVQKYTRWQDKVQLYVLINKVIRLVGRTYVRVNVQNCSFNDYTLGPSPLSVVCTQLYGCYKLLIGSRNSFSTTAQIVVDRKNDSLISRR